MAVVGTAFGFGKVGSRGTEGESSLEMAIPQNHPVENILGVEGQLLADTMPFLQFIWDFKECAREEALIRVVVYRGKPKEDELVLAQAFGFIGVAEAKFDAVERGDAGTQVGDEVRQGGGRTSISLLKVGVVSRDSSEKRLIGQSVAGLG